MKLMVCQSCKDQKHEECRGGTWCDCLHRIPKEVLDSIDRMASDSSYGVRREWPVRKPEEPSSKTEE